MEWADTEWGPHLKLQDGTHMRIACREYGPGFSVAVLEQYYHGHGWVKKGESRYPHSAEALNGGSKVRAIDSMKKYAEFLGNFQKD